MPGAYHKASAMLVLVNSEFVTKAITELQEYRGVCKLEERLHVCSPLAVVVDSKDKSLVLNLRYLNQFLLRRKV